MDDAREIVTVLPFRSLAGRPLSNNYRHGVKLALNAPVANDPCW
jgi:hypothetical protein